MSQPNLSGLLRRPLAFLVLVVIGGFGLGCTRPSFTRPVITGETMGTTYRVTLASGIPSDEVEGLKSEIDAELVRFNAVFSTYEPESDISRFNHGNVDEPVPVDFQLAECLRRASKISSDSEGAFDPTVGPLVNRWQFGPGRSQLEPPTDAEIAALKEQVGWRFVEASTGDGAESGSATVKKSHADVQLDLSAIAKGRGVDRLCQFLRSKGFDSMLVDIGGELRAVGRKPDGSPWRVAVRDPADPLNPNRQSPPVSLTDAAMATSGSYFNYHEVDGVRYSHTIDPRTGRPVTHDLVSVTVIACDCEIADAYATTLMVLGPDAGYDWASQRAIAAMLIREDGSTRLTDAYQAWLDTGVISCPNG